MQLTESLEVASECQNVNAEVVIGDLDELRERFRQLTFSSGGIAPRCMKDPNGRLDQALQKEPSLTPLVCPQLLECVVTLEVVAAVELLDSQFELLSKFHQNEITLSIARELRLCRFILDRKQFQTS